MSAETTTDPTHEDHVRAFQKLVRTIVIKGRKSRGSSFAPLILGESEADVTAKLRWYEAEHQRREAARG